MKKIEYSSDFKRRIKRLRKKYRHIRSDIDELIDRLQVGNLPGDKLTQTGYDVYKVRIRNRDMEKGKSGGYRVIYYVRTSDAILLVTIYTKAEFSDIPAETIRRIIQEHES